jgi:hypothetical protein
MSEDLRGLSFDNVMVEDTPLDVDLDLFLSDSFDDVSVGGKEDLVDDLGDIEYPHIKVSTRKFAEILKVSGIFAQEMGKEVIAKSVGMEVVGDKLRIYITNFELYATRDIDLINTDNKLGDFIVMNLPIISRFIGGLCPPVLTFYKKDDQYYIRMVGGDWVLETISVPKDRLVLKDKDKFVKEKNVLPVNGLCEALKGLYSVASSGITPAQRRIFVSGKEIFSVYMYCVAKYVSDVELPTMDFSTMSAKAVYVLCSSTNSESLEVYRNKNQVLLVGDDFSYSFMSDVKPLRELVDGMSLVLSGNSSNISLVYLKAAAGISSSLVYSTTRLEFNYTEDGDILSLMKTKRNDNVNVFKSNSDVRCTPLKENVGIQANLLKSILGVFPSKSPAKIFISDKGVGICEGRLEAVLYSEKIDTSDIQKKD